MRNLDPVHYTSPEIHAGDVSHIFSSTWQLLGPASRLAQRGDYIAAEFTSATFGFVDDLELRRTDEAVQVRSASRVGYSDGGVNKARVAELRDKLPQ